VSALAPLPKCVRSQVIAPIGGTAKVSRIEEES
jgi:hypothetical protein